MFHFITLVLIIGSLVGCKTSSTNATSTEKAFTYDPHSTCEFREVLGKAHNYRLLSYIDLFPKDEGSQYAFAHFRPFDYDGALELSYKVYRTTDQKIFAKYEPSRADHSESSVPMRIVFTQQPKDKTTGHWSIDLMPADRDTPKDTYECDYREQTSRHIPGL